MAVEGVLNGSQGPLLYPADELKQSALHWNGRPVVVYHPDMKTSSFAGHPDIFTKQRVGTLFNARFEGNALKADAWLDPERLAAVDTRILKKVMQGEVMEVSTGLLTDNEPSAGTWNGRAYKAVARNYRPDHLAILPNGPGACSVADGAGLCRNLEHEPLMMPVMNFGEED
jgi:hypothetical protein